MRNATDKNMSFDFTKYKETNNLIETTLPDKEVYYQDLNNIDYSLTGRIDAMFSNRFFQESVQLIINSITLFEKGYFDCAFYSLRQALEISTTSIYFADDSEDNRKKEMEKWIKQQKFPLHSQMLSILNNRKETFADIKDKMSDFFTKVESVKNRLNKYVHKQGIDKFYTYRGDKFQKICEKRKKDFIEFLKITIGSIGVYRLVIDPFPVLLSDEEIYKRTEQLMTENFGEDFIEKYIGKENIENYKKTNIYQDHYNSIMQNEAFLPSVLDIKKDDFIDRNKKEEITNQIHLLNKNEILSFLFSLCSEKISTIYCIGGFHWYITNTKSIKTDKSFNSSDFEEFKGKEIFNANYKDVYLTSVNVTGEDYFIEHNEIFDSIEIEKINNILIFCKSATHNS
jgi:hypothetical protein